MNPSVRSSCIALLALCLSPAPTALAASNTLKYTYDALGRLTFVEDAVNGNRDYDYDAAGNRTEVSVGVQLDESVRLPAATGLSCSGPMSSYGGYRATWNSVPGASYYWYEDESGKEIKTSSTTATLTYKCFDVRACSSSDSCGDTAYF